MVYSRSDFYKWIDQKVGAGILEECTATITMHSADIIAPMYYCIDNDTFYPILKLYLGFLESGIPEETGETFGQWLQGTDLLQIWRA